MNLGFTKEHPSANSSTLQKFAEYAPLISMDPPLCCQQEQIVQLPHLGSFQAACLAYVMHTGKSGRGEWPSAELQDSPSSHNGPSGPGGASPYLPCRSCLQKRC